MVAACSLSSIGALAMSPYGVTNAFNALSLTTPRTVSIKLFGAVGKKGDIGVWRTAACLAGDAAHRCKWHAHSRCARRFAFLLYLAAAPSRVSARTDISVCAVDGNDATVSQPLVQGDLSAIALHGVQGHQGWRQIQVSSRITSVTRRGGAGAPLFVVVTRAGSPAPAAAAPGRS